MKKLRAAITGQIGSGGEAPENDLEKLVELADLQKQMIAIADTLPDGTTWKGLATSAQSLLAAITGGEALRKAMYSGGLEQAMANVRSLFHLAECHRDRSVQVAPQENLFFTEAYEQFTKSAQS